MSWLSRLIEPLKQAKPKPAAVGAFCASNLDTPLLSLSSAGDHFTLRHVVEGLSVMGAVGSGKTTGPLANIVLPLLGLGVGGVFFCAKQQEREWIESLARQAGRSSSLLIVAPDQPNRLNILNYLAKRPGVVGSRIDQITEVFMRLARAGRRDSRHASSREPFWDESLLKVVRNAVQIFTAADEPLSASSLNRFIHSAATSHEQVHDRNWQGSSYSYELIQRGADRAEAGELNSVDRHDFELAARFYLDEFISFPDDTRRSVIATWSAAADPLMRGTMAELFGTTTTFVPELAFDGALIVLDIPTNVYGEAGAAVQIAFKHVLQLAVNSRKVRADTPVALIYADENHLLASPNTDATFYSTARDKRVANIVATQNLSNYLAKGGEGSRDAVEAMLGNLGFHIWCCNNHAATNKWAAESIANSTTSRGTWNVNGQGESTGGAAQHNDPKVLEGVFTELQRGGPPSFMTEAIVFRSGHRFNQSGDTWLRVAFPQVID